MLFYSWAYYILYNVLCFIRFCVISRLFRAVLSDLNNYFQKLKTSGMYQYVYNCIRLFNYEYNIQGLERTRKNNQQLTNNNMLAIEPVNKIKFSSRPFNA